MVSLRQKFPGTVGVACASAFALLLSATTADALTVSGRAYVIYINIPSAGIIDQTYIDTGYLPPTGGSESEGAVSLDVAGLVTTGIVASGSHGDDCEGRSDYTVDNAVILAGEPGELTFTHMHGDDDDQCCDSPGGPHAVYIEDLTFGGVPVNVTGEFEQTITIAGVGTLTLNHRHGGGHGGGHGGHGHGDGDDGGDEDCGDDHHIRVYGLFLSLETGGEVTVGSAFFRSDDHCCAVKSEAATWGGVKALYTGK